MKILGVHNYYGNYSFGGEGAVFEAEMALLAEAGHSIKKYACTNDAIKKSSIYNKIYYLWNSSWNKRSYNNITKEIKSFKPDIIHVHNYWFLLSPSIFRAASHLNVPVVITLHNYRQACQGGQLIRNGKKCEKCIHLKHPWPLLVHRCYKNLFFSILRYRLFRKGLAEKVWQEDINTFIALTKFGASKFTAAGLPANKIIIKGNCIKDPLEGRNYPYGNSRTNAIYAGRLSQEKGISSLIQAWQNIDYPLTVIGDGPLREELESSAPPTVSFVGQLSNELVIEQFKKAKMLIFPSECNEGFPLTLVEAMACNLPIIATRLGAMPSIINDKQTGLLYQPGNSNELQKIVLKLISDKKLATTLSTNARNEYLKKYTTKHNYQQLMDIYQMAINQQH